jgi:flagellar FliJ protein
MGFRFSLAVVLRLREIHEEREEQVLTQILARITQTREQLAAIQGQVAGAVLRREAQLSRQMSVAELHAAYALVQVLKARCGELVEEIRQLEQLRDKQILIYQAAHQNREVLSTMRAQQKESFRVEQGRREQTALDDIFMARRGRD